MIVVTLNNTSDELEVRNQIMDKLAGYIYLENLKKVFPGKYAVVIDSALSSVTLESVTEC